MVSISSSGMVLTSSFSPSKIDIIFLSLSIYTYQQLVPLTIFINAFSWRQWDLNNALNWLLHSSHVSDVRHFNNRFGGAGVECICLREVYLPQGKIGILYIADE